MVLLDLQVMDLAHGDGFSLADSDASAVLCDGGDDSSLSLLAC